MPIAGLELKGADVYFAIGQTAAESFVQRGLWMRSFYFDTLFQPRVHFHDTALLIGQPLRDHVLLRRGSGTWFETALHHGIAVPRVRADRSYRDIAQSMQAAGILGADTRMFDMAKRLDAVEHRRETWPSGDSMATTYCQRMARALSEQGIDAASASIADVEQRAIFESAWKGPNLADWRRTWVPRAAEKSSDGGLRVVDLLTAAYSDILGDAAPPGIGFDQLYDAVSDARPDLRTDVTVFFKVAIGEHAMNFAARCRCRVATANLDELSAPVVLSDGRGAGVANDGDAHHIATVGLPLAEDFDEVDGQVLHTLRASDEAGVYFAALGKWMSPAANREESASLLAGALEDYARLICEHVPRRKPNRFAVWAVEGAVGALGGVAGSLVWGGVDGGAVGGVLSVVMSKWTEGSVALLQRRRERTKIFAAEPNNSEIVSPLVVPDIHKSG